MPMRKLKLSQIVTGQSALIGFISWLVYAVAWRTIARNFFAGLNDLLDRGINFGFGNK